MEARSLLSTVTAAYGQLPIAFEPNVGQTSAGINYLAQGPGYSVALTSTGSLLALQSGSSSSERLVKISLVGANSTAQTAAQQPLPGVVNYLLGNDPSDWHTNIPTYGQVTYQNVYAGVDLVYHGNQGQLEYDFVVHTGASPGTIRLAIGGVQSLSLDAKGDLLLHTSSGVLTEQVPTVYQTINSVNQPVAGRYVIENGGQVGFAVGAYDAAEPLVIDPVLQYSTYIGGSAIDVSNAIAVDAGGDVYITGDATSTDFPTAGSPILGTLVKGATEAFVSKLNADGSRLLYSTYLAGIPASANDFTSAASIALDSSGDAFVAGFTSDSTFPTTSNALQGTLRGSDDAFVSELGPDGSRLVYSTFLGGSFADQAHAVAVDHSGNIYVVGDTDSSDFPTLNALQPSRPVVSSDSAFVTKINSTGQIAYSTYLGGTGGSQQLGDEAFSVAVDASGAAYVGGFTFSSDFPTAGNPVQSAQRAQQSNGDNGFIAKFAPSGTSLVYSTYLGGSNDVNGVASIAVDSAGDAYVAGDTDSSDFPTAGTPFQSTLQGTDSAYVSKLNPTGSALIYSTYLGGASGGSGFNEANALALDSSGDVYVGGDTSATDFPVAGDAPQAAYVGSGQDGFVTKLNAQGSGLAYSTFLAGAGFDDGTHGNNVVAGITLDSSDNVYVTGETLSTAFPVNPGVIQTVNDSIPQASPIAPPYNSFVTKLAPLAWQVNSVTVGSNDLPLLLWSGSDWADFWQFDSSLKSTALPTLGPVSGGWTAVGQAAGSDGLTRLLWQNTVTGQTALWLFNSNNVFQGAHVFKPLAGWTPIDMAVDSSNNLRVLWTNDSGQAMVSSINSSTFAVTTGPIFGPLSGWTALKLAAGGDGLLRLLWDNTNGQTSLWLLNADGSFHSATVFGPIPGWTAADVAVDNNNETRFLWSNPGGQGAIWDVNDSLTVTATRGFGTFPGFTPTLIETAANGNEFVLWSGASGSDVLWQLGSDNLFQQAAFFGPVVVS